MCATNSLVAFQYCCLVHRSLPAGILLWILDAIDGQAALAVDQATSISEVYVIYVNMYIHGGVAPRVITWSSWGFGGEVISYSAMPWDILYSPMCMQRTLIMCPLTCRGGKEDGKEGRDAQCLWTPPCIDCRLGYEHQQNVCDIIECTYVGLSHSWGHCTVHKNLEWSAEQHV